MLRILIVDDEFIEREGIKLLIRKYKFPLEIMEAENGEEALELLEEHHVDILFTDIKMPFMDGIELCRRARERDASLKIIIFSAYGEFEYAQKAIQYGITSYLLKPIDVQDFVKEFTQLVQTRTQEHDQEKEGLLLQLLQSGSRPVYRHEKPGASHGLGGRPQDPYGGKPVRLVLADTDRHVFDEQYDGFPELVRQALPVPFDCLNLNESQSVIFLPEDMGKDELQQRLSLLMDRLSQAYGAKLTLVVGRPAAGAEGLAEEFKRMEAKLEESFFYKESTVLFLDEALQAEQLSDTVPKLVETIHWHLEAKDDFGFRRGMELLFQTVEEGGQHSAVYIKYTCVELARKILEASGKWDAAEWQGTVEQIFACRNLSELKERVAGVMSCMGRPAELQSPEFRKKVIKDILKLIEENYPNDISLQWLADQVFLTQTYVSHLFSKEMGQTLVKYITQVRMQKACDLLRGSNRTVTEIREQVGYRNDSYFIKTFKNYYGVSPAKFRETVR